MIYYKVKKNYDNKALLTKESGILVNYGNFLIAGELYTPKEWNRVIKSHVFGCNPANCVEVVEVSKNKTSWFFGARFEI